MEGIYRGIWQVEVCNEGKKNSQGKMRRDHDLLKGEVCEDLGEGNGDILKNTDDTEVKS